MQDALISSYNGCKDVFNDTNILMCYFHLIKNVKKYTDTMDKNIADMILSDKRKLHFTVSVSEFEFELLLIMKKWGKKVDKVFIEYFNKQWINNKFSSWKVRLV